MRKDLLSIIKIDQESAVPVYRQIVHSVRRSIELGMLVLNDTLPSVNSIATEFGLARGSVFSAYNELRASGIIDSVPGKGYFIISTATAQKQKIFLLLDDFTAARADIYKCIRETMGPESLVEVFFHHDDTKRFQAFIKEKAAYYNIFIILPVLDYGTDLIETDNSKTLSIPGNTFSTLDNNLSIPGNTFLTPDNTLSTPRKALSTPDKALSTPDKALSTPDKAVSTPGWHAGVNSAGLEGKTAEGRPEAVGSTDPLSALNAKTVLILGGDFTNSKLNFEDFNLVAKTMMELPGILTKHFL